MFGIDAPEMRGSEREAGIVSRDWLRERILGKEIIIKTQKDKQGKYGRWLGEIYHESDTKREVSLNQILVDLKLAEKVDY